MRGWRAIFMMYSHRSLPEHSVISQMDCRHLVLCGYRFNQTNMNQHIAALLERYGSRSDLINSLAVSLGNSAVIPNLNLDQQLGQISQQLLGSLQVLIQDKLNAMNPAMNVPMMKKKKKKKGLGGKLKKMKKGFKKIRQDGKRDHENGQKLI